MEIKRKIEVSVRTLRRFVIRPAKNGEQIFCAVCGDLMIGAEAAAKLLGVSRRDIYRVIETGAIHFAETEAGAVLICLTRHPES